ncbi:hypothetical protein [uncultured Flavobacterium sp.]|uniref:DUF6929 family protein n=1 Tax=uncultured Flavobacterium sp. TaxID=165435 RepID=UPI0030CA4958
MQDFTLELQFKITGIGSASGIIYKDNLLFIISDNGTFLYQYDIEKKKLAKIKLFENGQENIPKKDKYDFESICLKENKLYILGSGSTSKREKRISYNLQTKEVKEKDITKLYQKLKNSAAIYDDDLNIEGSLFYNEKWCFFQRGNGANSKNGVFISNQNDNIIFSAIKLPKIKHIETSFTDAILVEEKIYFLATAEDTTSTYNDGEILGSIIGRLDVQSMQIDFTHKITDTHKFEGLTLYNKTKDKIEFLLCEDNDTEALETNIYKLSL